MSFNGKKVADNQIEGLLSEVHNVDKDIPVLIRADVTTQLGKVTYVWDACRKNGMMKISLQSQ